MPLRAGPVFWNHWGVCQRKCIGLVADVFLFGYSVEYLDDDTLFPCLIADP
jgi:hypothetical protein